MKALYLPGPAFHDENVKTYAGWHKVLKFQKEAIEEAGFEVVVPEVPREYIDNASSFSQIASYSLFTSQFLNSYIDLIVAAPSFGHHSIFRKGLVVPKVATYVWNQADWFRDQQLLPEYQRFHAEYRTLPINNLMNEMALKLSNVVVANSNHTKMTHSKIVPESKIKVAMWGVDSKVFRPGDRTGFKVLFFGSDIIRKGFVYLFEAMKRVLVPGMELWVLGCDPWGEANPPPQVRIFGMVPHEQIPEIIRQCHVQVLPTLEDGMPLSVQECMASGVVPITTECAAEAFEDNVSGFVVPYRDSEMIATHLLELKSDQGHFERMSKAARARAETQTWERFKEQFASIVLEVISG